MALSHVAQKGIVANKSLSPTKLIISPSCESQSGSRMRSPGDDQDLSRASVSNDLSSEDSPLPSGHDIVSQQSPTLSSSTESLSSSDMSRSSSLTSLSEHDCHLPRINRRSRRPLQESAASAYLRQFYLTSDTTVENEPNVPSRSSSSNFDLFEERLRQL